MNHVRQRRIVVTGMGAVTPLGNTLVESWQALLQRDCGITTLEEAIREQNIPESSLLECELEMAAKLPCRVAAPVRNVEHDHRTNRFVQFALMAGKEALEQANLLVDKELVLPTKDRIGVSIGSGMSSVREIVEAARTMQSPQDQESVGRPKRLSPHFVPRVLVNSAAGRVAVEYGLSGPNLAPSTACAAGAHAIGEAARCIAHNDADVMLAGGTESSIDPLSLNGFCRLRALSSNPDPRTASRPFDAQRDGFVMGEGSAVLVLEELQHALQRQAPILAELGGYGLSGDGYHITSPDPQGKGAERAILQCLQSANHNINDDNERSVIAHVDYVNAHATSTPMGDEIEARAIGRALSSLNNNNDDDDDYHYSVSSTKGATGHLLGAAGAVEAAFTVLALRDGVVPPTLNLQSTDTPPAGFRHVTETLHKDNLSVALTNSFGFGGTNASILFDTTCLALRK